MGDKTSRTFITWNWREDPKAPRAWPNPENVVALCDGLHSITVAGSVEASAATSIALGEKRGIVFVMVEKDSDSILSEPSPRIIPALRVERMADLHEGDGLRALCTVPAAHRALVITPREQIAIGLLGTLPGAWTGGAYRIMSEFVDLVIVEGPTGPDAWPMRPAWVSAIRDECVEAGVAFAFIWWGRWEPCSQIVGVRTRAKAMMTINEGTPDEETFLDFRLQEPTAHAFRTHLLDGREHLALPEGL